MAKYTRQRIVHDRYDGVRKFTPKQVTKAEYKKARKTKGAKVVKNKVTVLLAPERVYKLSGSVGFYVFEKQKKGKSK